jgi:hypothetical protein
MMVVWWAHTASGGHRRVNIGQRRIRRVDPTHPRPPPRINHYANNMLQYVTNCLVSAPGAGSSVSNVYECSQLRCQ